MFWYNQLRENMQNKKIGNFELIIVVGIAANKSDMFELEETDENKAKLFAKEIGAVFKYTSAKNSIGVDVCLNDLGII